MLNDQERERLLQQRAARELEAAGYALTEAENGAFLLLNAKTRETIAQFESIERLGMVMGLWGEDADQAAAPKLGRWIPPSRDAKTGLDSPELAAVREKARRNEPPLAKPNKGPQPPGKERREAHRR